jgi:ketosteroid isomerase-like protein
MFSQHMTSAFRPTLIAAGLLCSLTGARAQSTTARAVDELLAVDREHASGALSRNVVDALAGMFADDVVMSAMGAFHIGRETALAQLRSVPENLNGRLEWAPVRGGISADGQHGFTFGFMTLVRADSTRLPLKYLAYWMKKGPEWKVAVYRRVRRPEGEGRPRCASLIA